MPEPVLFLLRDGARERIFEPLNAEEIDTIFRALEDVSEDDERLVLRNRARALIDKLREAENG